MNKLVTLSIVIPCYNEAENIPELFKRFSQSFSNKNEVEIIFVNNGSTDNSSHVFNQMQAKYQNLNTKIVIVEENKGYGFGINQGLMHATGEILSWTHADLQTDPSDVLKGLEIYSTQIKEKNFIIKGKRINRPFIDKFFTFGMQIVALIKTQFYMDDINAQPKIFSSEFYTKISALTPPPSDFSLDLYLLLMAKKLNYKIIDYPVDFGKRFAGEAKGGGSLKTKFKLTKRTFKYILNFK